MNIFKKLLYIIPLLAMLSCTERWEDDFATDDTLSTTISVVLPQLPEVQSDTRAITKVNELKTLHLAVFDESGQLTQYLATEITGNEGNVYTYKVNGLKPSDSPRIIHFIGNGPRDVNYGDEVAVIANLYTAENGLYADAYWQRKVLNGGIAKDEATQTALSNVHLIRNFAWIQLTSSTDNFTIDSYYVVNTYNRGTIAPYNTTVGKGWISSYEDKSYSALVGEGYHGFTPPVNELNNTIPGKDDNVWHAANSETPYYIYERELNDKTPSYILVKGTYYPDGKTVTTTAKKDRYYKIDLRDANGDYFPIIRNFKYSINIKGIGHAGYDSPLEAASSGVSTASNTQSFTNIANEVVRLFVEYTEKTLVYDYNANSTETLQLEFTLRYKFIDLSTSTSHNDKTNVTINPENQTGDVISYLHRVRNEGEEDADDADGWRTITMKTVSIPVNKELDKRQEIVIVGELNGYTLQRKVTLKLRSRYTMDVSCDPNEIIETLGSPFDLVIWVPGGLGSSMFPLDFQIEAQEQSITPNQGDDLPAGTGGHCRRADVHGSGGDRLGYRHRSAL